MPNPRLPDKSETSPDKEEGKLPLGSYSKPTPSGGKMIITDGFRTPRHGN